MFVGVAAAVATAVTIILPLIPSRAQKVPSIMFFAKQLAYCS
jgi:hypothetical protein